MKLTVQVKLLPTEEQAKNLKLTLETVNCACNRLSQLGWDKKETRQFPMHKLFYHQLRSEFPLTAQIVVRLIAKVADAYKLDRDRQRTFRKHGSISYDSRILDFQLPTSTVSIWVMNGRIKHLSFVCGERQRKLLELPKGEADLILRDDQWYLNVTVDVPEETEREAVGWLGIDLGLVNIAQSSDGKTFGDAKKIAGIRERRHRQRKRLQAKGTRSAKRVLRRLSGRESRFVKQENHLISKQICAEAKRTKQGIALENLKDIRLRIRANKKQRRKLHSWAFADLQSKIVYKSSLLGIPVKFVDPRNSSRTCPACGHVSKKNRPTRDKFDCVKCGFTAEADTSAATILSRRADVIPPNERNSVSEVGLRGFHVQGSPFTVG